MSARKQSYKLDTLPGPGDSDNGHVNMAFQNEPGLDVGKKVSTGSAVVGPIPEEDGPQRDQWSNPIEFLLSCVAMSVGLGNIWRFPFTAYANGGGAFLIPYLIVLTFIGRPIYFLELCVGQFSSFGQVKIWKLAPFFKGVGYGSMIGTICVVSYYASIMGLTLFYFFASFQKTLPWSECNDDWIGLGRGQELDPETGLMEQVLFCNESDQGFAYMADGNRSNHIVSKLYFENEVLKQTLNIDDGIGAPEWRLTLCLLLSWILIWASIIKGVSSSGKVAYFTALFPYVVLLIMLIRGVTLPGAWSGIEKFLVPEWDRMLEAKVWYAAVGQCFFSLSTGFGPIIMFASYNPFKQNVYRDAWIISGLDTFTSLLAGIIVFSILGNLSHEMGIPIEEVAEGGPGLAFVSYPAAIARFDWVPQLFSVLFYLMLFTLGVGSATSLTGGVITVICDQFPNIRREIITTVVCISLFLVGLIYVTPGGQYMTDMIDHFGANFVIYVMATIEVIGIAWVYGLNRFINDIYFMLGVRIGWYWKFCWGFFIPVGLSAIFFYAMATEKPMVYGPLALEFPTSGVVAGWLLAAVAISVLPICAFHAVKTRKASGWMNRLKMSFKPTAEWGPRRPKDRADWDQVNAKQHIVSS